MDEQFAAPENLVAVGHEPPVQPVVAEGAGDAHRQAARRRVEPPGIRRERSLHRREERAAAAAVARQLQVGGSGLEIIQPAAQVALVLARFVLGAAPAILQGGGKIERGRLGGGIEPGGGLRLVGTKRPREVEQLVEGQVAADLFQQGGRQVQREQRIAFAEFLPQRVDIFLFQEFQVFRQSQETAVVTDQLQTKAVDRPEERAAQLGQQGLASGGGRFELLEHQVAGADPQLLGGQLAVGHHDQPREHVGLLMAAQGQVGNAPDDGRRLARPGSGRHAEVLVQGLGERRALVGIEEGQRRWRGGGHGVSAMNPVCRKVRWPQSPFARHHPSGG